MVMNEQLASLLIWPWKFKVDVMAKVKPIGHIWGLEFNQSIYKAIFTVI